MKKATKITSTLLTAALLLCNTMPVSAFAAEVTADTPAQATQTITVEKEVEPDPVEPSFCVEIPAGVTVSSGEATKMDYSISEEDLNRIPDGKKVAITIADAGYADTNGTFGLYNAETGEVASYGLYGSTFILSGSEPYQIGGKGYVSFYGNEKPVDGKYTMSRAIKVYNFDALKGGSYTGYITYNIALVNQ